VPRLSSIIIEYTYGLRRLGSSNWLAHRLVRINDGWMVNIEYSARIYTPPFSLTHKKKFSRKSCETGFLVYLAWELAVDSMKIIYYGMAMHAHAGQWDAEVERTLES